MSLAWHTAIFTAQAWAGKLKNLNEILRRTEQMRPGHNLNAQRLALLGAHIGKSSRPASPEAIAALARLKAQREQVH